MGRFAGKSVIVTGAASGFGTAIARKFSQEGAWLVLADLNIEGAEALAKELTNHSLPEIGDAFGGRDHTTVLHACKKIVELQETDPGIREDYQNFMRLLTS